METLRRFLAVPLTAVLALSLLANPAHAATIWSGDPSGGLRVFGNMNCDSPGSVTAVDDPAHGRVWRYNKPSGSNRCENHGIAVGGKRYEFRNGSTYYLGWRSKLSSAVNNNATFQWKSYGNHIQNFPVVLKVISGRISILQRQPGGVERITWSRPITANTWHTYVLGLHLSSATTGGWVEFWFDGQKQTFTNNSQRWACRTWDSINEPKWGIYGASGTSVANYVDALKVGTAYSDVAP
ncbi:heparin lyase I family protein [Kibdelosporangium aridum]|uniref:Polysaccharide lyase n=1 Tax=Kibdelosporangium aridum TaxID=2030 RepID=A0A1Y5Y757_KIBAR|nr:heparin lyase I family protein [Kibdelosporangium aridum]SMD24907.1 Polysaccharide lyase [Kibdelosporangium aridum]